MALSEQETIASFAVGIRRVTMDNFDSEYPSLVLTAQKISKIRQDKLIQGDDAYKAFVAWCIPVWEVTSFHASSFSSVRNDVEKHAKILQLLSFVYPEATDRRCYFKPLSLRGDEQEAAGHLRVPIRMEIVTFQTLNHGPPSIWQRDASSFLTLLQRLFADPWSLEETIGASGANGALQLRGISNTMQQLLDRVVVVAETDVSTIEAWNLAAAAPEGGSSSSVAGAAPVNSNGDAWYIALTSSCHHSCPRQQSSSGTTKHSSVGSAGVPHFAFTLRALRCVLFKIFSIGMRCKEFLDALAPLARFVLEKCQSKRAVVMMDPVTGEASRTAPQRLLPALSFEALVGDTILLAKSIASGCRPTAPGAENARIGDAIERYRSWAAVNRAAGNEPLCSTLSPKDVVMSKASLRTFCPVTSSSCSAEHEAYDDEEGGVVVASLASKLSEQHHEQTTCDIPGEAQFSDNGSCNSLRDPDRLVRYLRDVVRLPMIGEHQDLVRNLMFQRRKRQRQTSGSVATECDGRVLMPKCESLGDLLDVRKADLTVQEQIILHHGKS